MNLRLGGHLPVSVVLYGTIRLFFEFVCLLDPNAFLCFRLGGADKDRRRNNTDHGGHSHTWKGGRKK